MSSTFWSQIEWLFEAALERDPDHRMAWLHEACSNAEICRQVAQMLEATEKLPGFLEESPEIAFRMLANDPVSGRRIGSYRTVRKIGSGGMGIVYQAERADGQYDHEVAIKVLQHSIDEDGLTRRFDDERQILATLEHPNIARMYDSGLDAAGRPYLVMELLEGMTITDYCDAERLPIRDRLRLFRDVCGAVAYAHRNLVVHRDLKPSNILVTTSGEVKLLDFGIAKLLGARSDRDRGPITRDEQRAMTPGYASPEQLRGETVGTNSDVYQLGVLLYELVIGVRPFASTESFLELERQQDAGPNPPSRRLGEMSRRRDHRLAEICKNRATSCSALRRRLSGDVDAMISKALKPDSRRRYPSADHFAEDIEKHLSGRPVSARSGTWHYRTARFVRRNRVAAVASAVIGLLLAAYVATVVRHGIVAERLHSVVLLERDQAVRESEKATVLADHLAATLESLGPYALQSNGVDADRFLSQTLADIDRRFADEPELKSNLWDVLGRVYQRYGAYGTAQALLERALAERLSIFGTPHELVAESMEHLGWLMQVRGDYPTALDQYADAMTQIDQLGSAGSELKADVLLGMATTLMTLGEYGRAEELTRASVAIRDSLFGRSDPAYAAGLASLGYLFTRRGRVDQAEAILNEALTVRTKVYGRKHSEVAESLLNLGWLYERTGNDVRAESLYVEALDIRRSLYGPTHPRVAHVLADLGWLRMKRGDLDAAERDLLKAAEIRVETLGPDHLNVAHSWKMIGELRVRQGRSSEATEFLTRARDLYESLYGPDHPAVAVTQELLDQVRDQDGSG